MFKNVKNLVITSITAAALLTTSASLVAKADDTTDNQTPVTQTTTDSQNNANNNQNSAQDTNSNDDSDDGSVSIKLNPKKNANDTQFTSLQKVANKHLHARYIYGATGPTSFDCSGFTRYIYKHSLGVTLPRTAQAQYNYGTKVSEANAKKGDLVFFGSSKSSITHVGMYLGNGKMIDAQNRGVVKENVHASWWHLVGFASMN